MPGPSPSPRPPSRRDARLAGLDASVDALRTDLAELRASLALEVRTRQLVLTARDGVDRLVASASGHNARAALQCRSDGDEPTGVGLFANDAGDAGGCHAGMMLTLQGNVVAAIDVVAGDRPDVWIDERP